MTPRPTESLKNKPQDSDKFAAKAKTAPSYNYTHQLQVGGKNILVEIADAPQKMEQGLSGREPLTDEQGMLFNFGKTETTPSFWMKGMKFNLDFVWIKNNKVVGITADVSAPDRSSTIKDSDLPLYFPPSPITWVLEMNSGWAKKNNLQVGDGVIEQELKDLND